MNQRPTPETDEIQRRCLHSSTDHLNNPLTLCRRLERQRDEALEDTEAFRAAIANYRDVHGRYHTEKACILMLKALSDFEAKRLTQATPAPPVPACCS